MSRVQFPSRDGLLLEGERIDGGGAPCVVSHPHPLAGGTMDHPVAEGVWRAAGAAGLDALRYNYHGVGASQGEFARDQPLATADLAGAIEFLGGGPVLAIGYSYGALATLAGIGEGLPIARAALLALPTRLPVARHSMSNLLLGRAVEDEEFDDTPGLELLDDPPVPLRVFAGGLDPLVQDEKLGRVECVRFEGLNHFFARRLGNLPPHPADLAALAGAVLGFLTA